MSLLLTIRKTASGFPVYNIIPLTETKITETSNNIFIPRKSMILCLFLICTSGGNDGETDFSEDKSTVIGRHIIIAVKYKITAIIPNFLFSAFSAAIHDIAAVMFIASLIFTSIFFIIQNHIELSISDESDLLSCDISAVPFSFRTESVKRCISSRLSIFSDTRIPAVSI